MLKCKENITRLVFATKGLENEIELYEKKQDALHLLRSDIGVEKLVNKFKVDVRKNSRKNVLESLEYMEAEIAQIKDILEDWV